MAIGDGENGAHIVYIEPSLDLIGAHLLETLDAETVSGSEKFQCGFSCHLDGVRVEMVQEKEENGWRNVFYNDDILDQSDGKGKCLAAVLML